MELILAFAGIALTPQPTEQLADRKRIVALIKQLDDDDFRTRDQATRALRLVGHGAWHLLNEATGSVELRERTERLAKAIRLVSFRPGKTAEGLQATLRTDGEVFRAEQPIAMQLEIKSVSAADLMLPQALRWGYRMTYGPDKHRVLGYYVPCHAYIEMHQLSGRKGEKIMSPIACGHPGFGEPMQLKAGGLVVYAVPATMVRLLLPGEYEIRVLFQTCYMNKLCKESIKASALTGESAAQAIRGVNEHALISNTVRFTVE